MRFRYRQLLLRWWSCIQPLSPVVFLCATTSVFRFVMPWRAWCHSYSLHWRRTKAAGRTATRPAPWTRFCSSAAPSRNFHPLSCTAAPFRLQTDMPALHDYLCSVCVASPCLVYVMSNVCMTQCSLPTARKSNRFAAPHGIDPTGAQFVRYKLHSSWSPSLSSSSSLSPQLQEVLACVQKATEQLVRGYSDVLQLNYLYNQKNKRGFSSPVLSEAMKQTFHAMGTAAQ